MEKQVVIGVLTWRSGKRFAEPEYLRRLALAGREEGVLVFLFSHQDVFTRERQIRGFVPHGKNDWKVQWFPWPKVVIDRYRRRVPAYMKLRNSDMFFFANSPFGKKWKVTQVLSRDKRVKEWVPQTALFAPGRVRAMLKRHQLVYLKPGNGTGGRSILRIEKADGCYKLSGRDRNLAVRHARLKSTEQVERYVSSWVQKERLKNGNFIVQQGIHLISPAGRVADMRLLIQRDGHGEWSVTGASARIGEEGSATSNLHNGGRAMPVSAFLMQCFSEKRVREILEECAQMAHQVVSVLEERYGRMMEFGLDIGVDQSGKPWLLEVNPKPGRDVFLQMGDIATYEQAVRRPIQFARYLAVGRGER
ncbi:YheC/YheD family protein [Brevibacillus sp. TJ4]|uniref:YheC/YheD family endospore coat-associated protein n=1 Tax=Brevibacillus sp. TJ4 TaxID=3234853 RepID=UPI003BA2258C